MNEKLEFLEKLRGLVDIARGKRSQITIGEVTGYFKKEELTEEQMELVFDYLLAQKIVVKGYVKMESAEVYELSEEEKEYLSDYEKNMELIQPVIEGETEKLFTKIVAGDEEAKARLVEIYMKEVVEKAKEMARPEAFIGDLIQEGNIGVILGIEQITDPANAHDTIMAQMKASMRMLIESQVEVSSCDKKMIEKVQLLDEGIKNLTEELGRKVTIDELAIHMGMEIEEIEDILKLTGEEPEAEEEN